MLMVIFGAGASYDSYSSIAPLSEVPRDSQLCRPPLAKELFLRHFQHHLDQFPQAKALVPHLEPHGQPDVAVEEVLERLQSEAERDNIRASQMLAVRYYLRKLIQDCELEWTRQVTHGVTNYRTLWDQIRRAKPVLAVSFNYDTLFENALNAFGIAFRTLEDYMSRSRCQLIKPHGSIDWEAMVEYAFPKQFNEADAASHLIERAQYLRPTEIYRLAGQSDGTNQTWVPALAIPTMTKSHFACPEDQLVAFRESAREVDRILVIGWRASEQHFLRELATAIQRPVRVWAVCESEDAAKEPIERLKSAGIRASDELA